MQVQNRRDGMCIKLWAGRGQYNSAANHAAFNNGTERKWMIGVRQAGQVPVQVWLRARSRRSGSRLTVDPTNESQTPHRQRTARRRVLCFVYQFIECRRKESKEKRETKQESNAWACMCGVPFPVSTKRRARIHQSPRQREERSGAVGGGRPDCHGKPDETASTHAVKVKQPCVEGSRV
jgi:hypothetical protein